MRSVWLVALCALFMIGCATDDPVISPQAVNAPTRSYALPSLTGSSYRVQRGDTLWRIAHAYGVPPQTIASMNHLQASGPLTVGQLLFIPLPAETSQFLWPVRGVLRGISASRGLALAAPSGTLVRAARGGRVSVATRGLAGWGNTVVLEHRDGYVSIYAGLEQLLVTPGMWLRQGMPLGMVGVDPLYFEIRYGVRPQDAMALLPREP